MKILIMTLLCISHSSLASLIPDGLYADSANMIKNTDVPLSYQAIANEVLLSFNHEAAAEGAEFALIFKMDNAKVNATATREENKWIITFYGGLLKHKNMTEDVFLTIFCHELGHHIGGAPYKYRNWPGRSWASAEGQSDYFATNICLKKYLEHKDNINDIEVDAQRVSEVITNGCEKNHLNLIEKDLCIRSSIISDKTGKFIAQLGKGRRNRRQKEPNIHTPDQSKITHTSVSHPPAQCRLDTFFQGSLCTQMYISTDDDLSCKNDWSHTYTGARPRCWYAPPIIRANSL